MITIQTPIVRSFADIAQAVSDAILPQLQAAELAIRQQTQLGATASNIEAINFQFGHFKEIVATMKEYEASPEHMSKKYPLIALLMDFPEPRGRRSGYYGDVTLQLILAFAAQPTTKVNDRYDLSFIPILYPLYEELLEQIVASPAFVNVDADSIEHTKTDRPYYGKDGLMDTDRNVFPDFIDAIEISNMKLTTNFPNC